MLLGSRVEGIDEKVRISRRQKATKVFNAELSDALKNERSPY